MQRPGITTLLIAVLLTTGCASVGRVAPPDNALGADEIRALFSGQTVKSVTFSKGRVSDIYYMASGELRQLRNGKVRSGTWRVQKKGRLCLQIEDNDENCRAIVKAGNTYVKYIVSKDGNHRPVVRYISFTPGNPLNL